MVDEKKKPNQFWKSNIWTAPKSNNKPLEFMHKPVAVAQNKPMFNSKPKPNIFTQSKPVRFFKGDGRLSEPKPMTTMSSATETPIVKTIIYPPTEGNGRISLPRKKGKKKKKIKYVFGAGPSYNQPKKRRSMNKKQLKHFLTRYERDPMFRKKVKTRFLGDGALQKPDSNKPAWRIMPDNWKRISEGKCATCGGSIIESEFHPIEKKEYSISGMCHKCQRDVFGDGAKSIPAEYDDMFYGGRITKEIPWGHHVPLIDAKGNKGNTKNIGAIGDRTVFGVDIDTAKVDYSEITPEKKKEAWKREFDLFKRQEREPSWIDGVKTEAKQRGVVFGDGDGRIQEEGKDFVMINPKLLEIMTPEEHRLWKEGTISEKQQVRQQAWNRMNSKGDGRTEKKDRVFKCITCGVERLVNVDNVEARMLSGKFMCKNCKGKGDGRLDPKIFKKLYEESEYTVLDFGSYVIDKEKRNNSWDELYRKKFAPDWPEQSHRKEFLAQPFEEDFGLKNKSDQILNTLAWVKTHSKGDGAMPVPAKTYTATIINSQTPRLRIIYPGVSQETIQKYKMTQPENETIEIKEEYKDEGKRVL